MTADPGSLSPKSLVINNLEEYGLRVSVSLKDSLLSLPSLQLLNYEDDHIVAQVVAVAEVITVLVVFKECLEYLVLFFCFNHTLRYYTLRAKSNFL